MKQKIKRMISMLCMFMLFTGFLIPLMGIHKETVEVNAAVTPEYHKNCPYGSTQWEHTGVAVCWACSKNGCMDCGATGVYGRMYYGNIINDGIHNDMPDVMDNYYNEKVKNIVAKNGEHSENYHRGYGYNSKKVLTDGDGNYKIIYYACWNCVYGGVSSDIYKDELILYTEYYTKDGELDTLQGDNGIELSPKYGKPFTSQIGHVLTFKEGPGITPTYWCPQCGPELYEMYKAADPNYGYASPANRLKSIDDVLDYTPYAITNLITESSGSQFHLPAQYKLTLEVFPSGAGTVSLDGTTYRETVSDTYYAKEGVSASQKAKDGYVFKGWYDLSLGEVPVSDEETLNTRMPSADTTWTAVFESAAKYQLKVTAGEGGTVNDVSGAYSAGTPLSVKATPKEHYKLEWTGYDFGSGIIEDLNSGDVNKTLLQFDMPEQDITLHANFISPTPTPTPVPGKANIAVNIKYSSHYTESGETSEDGTESSLDTEYLGTEVQYSFASSAIYDGYTYELESVDVPSGRGLTSVKGDSGYVVSGEISADVTITVFYKRTVTPPPHECKFGDWIHNPEIHWKECKECKAQAEEGKHIWNLLILYRFRKSLNDRSG